MLKLNAKTDVKLQKCQKKKKDLKDSKPRKHFKKIYDWTIEKPKRNMGYP